MSDPLYLFYFLDDEAGQPDHVVYRKSTDNGDTWSSPVEISPDYTPGNTVSLSAWVSADRNPIVLAVLSAVLYCYDGDSNWAETTIWDPAPTDPIYILGMGRDGSNKIWTIVRQDTGATKIFRRDSVGNWTDVALPASELSTIAYALCFDSSGNPWLLTGATTAQAYVRAWKWNGTSWDAQSNLTTTQSVQETDAFSDDTRVTVAPFSLDQTLNDTTPRPAYIKQGTNELYFRKPATDVQIASSSWKFGAGYAASFDGTGIILLSSRGDGSGSSLFQSTDAGATWTRLGGANFVSGTRSVTMWIANDTYHVAWGSSDGLNIFYRKWKDNAWSANQSWPLTVAGVYYHEGIGLIGIPPAPPPAYSPRYLSQLSSKRKISFPGSFWDTSGALDFKTYFIRGQKIISGIFIASNDPNAGPGGSWPLHDPNAVGRNLPAFWPGTPGSPISPSGADIWRFYRNQKGMLKPFWLTEGFPRANLTLSASASVGATALQLASTVGLTKTLNEEGQIIAIADPSRRTVDIVGVCNISGSQVSLKRALNNAYATDADIYLTHAVVFDAPLKISQPHRHIQEFEATFRVISLP